MKLQVRNFFVLFVLVLASCTGNQLSKTADNSQKALLWKIEGQGIEPSYVYGTIHMLKEEDFEMKPAVKEAFAASERVVLELDMDDPSMQMAIIQHVQMKDGHSLKALLSESDYQKFDEYMQTNMGVSAQVFDRWMPAMLSSLMMTKILGEKPASFEGAFVQMAKQQEKEVLGLETVEYQMNIFHGYPYEDQAESLSEYLNQPELLATEFESLVRLYKSEDINKLHKVTSDYFKDSGMNAEAFLDSRNKNWIPKMNKFAGEQATFFAVGAAHLGGPNGVVALLKKEGYTLTPVN